MLRQRINGPLLINKDSSLKDLNTLIKIVGDDQKDLVKRKIEEVSDYINIDQKVLEEILRVNRDIIVLQNVYFKDDYPIDFIIITSSFLLILEDKKMFGEIVVNENSFTKIYKMADGVVYKKEAMFSPMIQNRHHKKVLDNILKHMCLREVNVYCYSIISDENTHITFDRKSELSRNGIIKLKDLQAKIDHLYEVNNEMDLLQSLMFDILHKIEEEQYKRDYIKELNLILKEENPFLDDNIYEALRVYRKEKAKEYKTKPYYIFNDDQLAALLINKPKNREEFITIHGFGNAKYAKYGRDIISIIHNGCYIKDAFIDNMSASDDEFIPNDKLQKALKAYRYNKAKELNVPAYEIFTNKQMMEILKIKPSKEEDFLQIEGFNEAKAYNLSKGILEILNKEEEYVK